MDKNLVKPEKRTIINVECRAFYKETKKNLHASMNDAVKYIKKCLKLGIAETAINQELNEAGWDESTIRQAWLEARSKPSQKLLGWLRALLTGKGKILAIPGTIIVLLLGGYLAYANLFAGSPDRIWGKAYVNTTKANSWKSQSEISYADKSASGEEFSLTATSNGGYILEGKALPDFVLNSETKIKGQGIDFGFALESRKIGNTLYYKLGSAQILSALLNVGPAADPARPEWLKIDLDKKGEGRSLLLEFVQTFQGRLEEFRKPFGTFKFLKLVKRLGSDKVGEVPVWRYEAEINNEELKNYFGALTRALGSEKQFEELNKTVGEVLNALLEKLDFRKVEIWIGKKDKRVYQIVIETNAPSFVNADLINSPPSETKNFQQYIEALPFTATLTIKSRFSNFDEPVSIQAPPGAVDYFEYLEKAAKTSVNAKAMANVRQVMTALELYFNDYGRYPERIGHLTPGNNKFNVNYIQNLPKPLTDPICQGINEFFNYAPSADGKGYSFDFCLTTATGTLSAGRHQASPQGIR